MCMCVEEIELSCEELVPGDVILIHRHGGMMHCDAVITSGNCVVNESMLTGQCLAWRCDVISRH